MEDDRVLERILKIKEEDSREKLELLAIVAKRDLPRYRADLAHLRDCYFCWLDPHCQDGENRGYILGKLNEDINRYWGEMIKISSEYAKLYKMVNKGNERNEEAN